jgi:hypothetical protein
MFTQVIMAIFDLMIEFEYFWKDTKESWPSSIFGFGLGVREDPPSVSVDTDALYSSYISGFDKYDEVWRRIIPKPELDAVRDTRKIAKKHFYYPSDLWARILFNFAIAYRNMDIPNETIIESMIPFYHSRILSFVNKTADMDIKECEEYFESVVRVFEAEKSYLIKRWDEEKRNLGHKLFTFESEE